ncbi:Uncharacterised protein [Burkholderia pseudomallei]|nr:Uncharacterised protein [Burkholderia pseudomallei]CAJ3343556.1 Uncharacterised protein [Burkholderia pseudomallei]CAJ3345245.1 Uncharacterised protein [Burkholderia pseudomallei]CAJ3932154.1 Uncharacterised protein [Burkholderia pseudomallei]CAJ4565443.1 Uncharacterised protein [Burkholderia pseudomallei]
MRSGSRAARSGACGRSPRPAHATDSPRLRARPSPPSAVPSSPTCRSHRQGGAASGLRHAAASKATRSSATHPRAGPQSAAHRPAHPAPCAPPRPPARSPAGCRPGSRASAPMHSPGPAAHMRRPPSGSPTIPSSSRRRARAPAPRACPARRLVRAGSARGDSHARRGPYSSASRRRRSPPPLPAFAIPGLRTTDGGRHPAHTRGLFRSSRAVPVCVRRPAIRQAQPIHRPDLRSARESAAPTPVP